MTLNPRGKLKKDFFTWWKIVFAASGSGYRNGKKKKIVQLIASEVHENETHYHPPRIYLLIWKKTIA